MPIRPFDPARDGPALRACFVELQEAERALDPGMPAGEAIAGIYLERLFRDCREFEGVVLVAEEAGAVAGFVCVLTRYRSPEPDDDPTEHGVVSDLVVLDAHRGAGLGRRLLRAAEARVRAAGQGRLRVMAKAENAPAVALYREEGFVPAEVVLEKRLD